ncbi:MAG: hypothetical protein EPN94_07510 [Nitrospirae bacterium]|nr:MAG: hypothetical protein EPN94_07510 [Nitrospirota bacterium]
MEKGDLVRHMALNKKGIVIRWGIFHEEYKRFLPLFDIGASDSIEVWVAGRSEIWALHEIEAVESKK